MLCGDLIGGNDDAPALDAHAHRLGGGEAGAGEPLALQANGGHPSGGRLLGRSVSVRRRSGKFSNLSERKLMDCLNRLDYDREIRVRPANHPVGHLMLAIA